MCGVQPDDPLAVQLEHQAQRRVRRRMLRPEVERPAVVPVPGRHLRRVKLAGGLSQRVWHGE